MVDTTLGQRYRLEGRIASGGMGSVFRAIDERLARPVAVKVLKEELAADPRFVERFRREARSVAALSHPNIANVFDYGEDEGRHFIVMELVEGRDLARVLREEGRLEPQRAAGIAEQVAAALGHAHAAGVVHRDVKPANVIVCDDGRVKVTDFGIARAVGESRLTGTGTVLGTAHYISPEHASGEPVGPPSDIYSLGIVLYEMLTGSVPFTGDSPIAVAMRHVSGEVPRPSELNPSVGEHLDEVVTRATKRSPRARFADGAEMARALRSQAVPSTTAVIAGGGAGTAVLPLQTEPGGAAGETIWPIPGDRWDPQRLGKMVLILFALLALTAAVLAALRAAGSDEAEPERRRGAGVQRPAASPSPSTVTVPNLIGDNFKDAKEVLEQQGLEAKEEKVAHELDKDTVVGMVPEPGTEVAPGTEITLLVSEGPSEEDDGDDDEHEDGDPGKGRGGPPEGKGPPGKEDE